MREGNSPGGSVSFCQLLLLEDVSESPSHYDLAYVMDFRLPTERTRFCQELGMHIFRTHLPAVEVVFHKVTASLLRVKLTNAE